MSMAYISQDITPSYILELSIQKLPVEQRAIIGLGDMQRALLPQNTKDYAERVVRYCENTQAFLSFATQSAPLASNTLLDCYRFRLSTNVVSLIFSNLLDLSEVDTPADSGMYTALRHLLAFYRQHCHQALPGTELAQVFDTLGNGKGLLKEGPKKLIKQRYVKEAMQKIEAQLDIDFPSSLEERSVQRVAIV